MKIRNPAIGNLISAANPLAINIGDAAIPGALGSVSDSGHQHAAVATGFARAGGVLTTEGTTSSTSEVDVAAITGISIPVGVPFLLGFSWRRDGGHASGCRLWFKLNATTIATAQNAADALLVSNNLAVATSGGVLIYVGARTALYLRSLAAMRAEDNGQQTGAWDLDNSDMPAAAITSIIVTGLVTNALNELGVSDMFCMLMPTTTP